MRHSLTRIVDAKKQDDEMRERDLSLSRDAQEILETCETFLYTHSLRQMTFTLSNDFTHAVLSHPFTGMEEEEGNDDVDVDGVEDDVGENHGESTSEEPIKLSKNAQRRLKRQEKWQQKKIHKKLKRKEERNAKGLSSIPICPPKEEDLPAIQARREERNAKKLEDRDTFLRHCQEGYRVVIDCGFDGQLTEKELSSLAQQIMYLHASNKKAAVPSFVYLTE